VHVKERRHGERAGKREVEVHVQPPGNDPQRPERALGDKSEGADHSAGYRQDYRRTAPHVHAHDD
jgi:hypothetical protein